MCPYLLSIEIRARQDDRFPRPDGRCADAVKLDILSCRTVRPGSPRFPNRSCLIRVIQSRLRPVALDGTDQHRRWIPGLSSRKPVKLPGDSLDRIVFQHHIDRGLSHAHCETAFADQVFRILLFSLFFYSCFLFLFCL